MTDFSRYREVIPYARYSSRGQARGTSEQRQVAAFEAFAAAHGITLSDRRAIDRGLSGFHGDNLTDGALGALVADLQRGVISTPALLLVERQDRFGRQATTQALVTLFADLLGRGCDIYHLHQARLYSRAIVDADFGALVTLAAEVHAAHHYSATLSQRSKVAHAVARDAMRERRPLRAGWAPTWIDRTPTGWKLNDYATTVLHLIELAESGLGQIAIARQLNAEGLPSPRGGRWHGGSVSHVLYSPAIAGGRELLRRSGDVVWDYWPGVITRPRREALLAAITQRTVGGAAPGQQDACRWVGQGLSVCTCGRPIGYRSCSYRRGGERVIIAYIRCRGRIDGMCQKPAVRLDQVHAHLLTRLQPQQLAGLIGVSGGAELTVARAAVDRLRQQLEQARAMAAAADREMTASLADGEAGAARVLARQVAAGEQRATELEAELHAAEYAVSALAAGPDPESLRQPVAALLQAFAAGDDTAEQRLAVNAGLRRLGVAIVVDAAAERMALQVNGGERDWQPIAELQQEFLARGRAGIRTEAPDPTALAIHDGEQVTLELDADFLQR